MSFRFAFDSSSQVLHCLFRGRVSNEELREFYRLVGEQVARIKPRAGVIDFSLVTAFDVSPQTIRDLAAEPPVMPDPREPRVVVAPAPSVYGMARMFQAEGQNTRPSLHVVRTLREACAIVGVQKLDAKPLPPE